MKSDIVYIDHILKSINNIFSYTQNLSKEDFARNSLIQEQSLEILRS